MSSMAAETLETYAEILELSRRMLSSAKAGNWDALIGYEAERQQAVAKLKRQQDNYARPLAQGEQAKVDALIQEILKLDEETTTLTQQCMADIKGSVAAIGVSKQLNNAYRRT
jgi:hypothetical protein